MAHAWIDSVKQGGQLSIYIDGGISGNWRSVSDRAVREFNQLSRRHGLGVTFSATTSQNAKLVIAVHELVHATGLSNSDHSPEGLFQASPPVDSGRAPGGDRVRRTGATQSGYMRR